MAIKEIVLGSLKGQKSVETAKYEAALTIQDHPAPVPERAGREGEQPIPTPGGESVFASVRRWLHEREVTGIRRYGRSLEAFNGRDAGRDAREEALDLLVYLEQARIEHAAVVEALLVLARATVATAGKVRGSAIKGFPTPEAVLAALDLAAKLEAAR